MFLFVVNNLSVWQYPTRKDAPHHVKRLSMVVHLLFTVSPLLNTNKYKVAGHFKSPRAFFNTRANGRVCLSLGHPIRDGDVWYLVELCGFLEVARTRDSHLATAILSVGML